MNSIPVIDLFAGPGGLGEGFSSLENGRTFKIVVSAEMEASAHKTLKLRAFFRLLTHLGSPEISHYYRFCNGLEALPFNINSAEIWESAGAEAQQLTLGNEIDNQKLFEIIKNNNLCQATPWVLIGGPPCQAYSIVGRSRNKGKSNYKAEEDKRHYLYKEYLKTIQKFKPAVFVMENVKGILTSKVNGKSIFETILMDLVCPDKALGEKDSGTKYKIFSLCTTTSFEYGQDLSEFNINEFVIKAEDYGIPQARHRVILLGVRNDINNIPEPLKKRPKNTVSDVLEQLPKIRSKLSKEIDSDGAWLEKIKMHTAELIREIKSSKTNEDVLKNFENLKDELITLLSPGTLRAKLPPKRLKKIDLAKWFNDDNLKVTLNHESRGHMSSDLRRYLFASMFAKTYGKSPKGHRDFNLESLRPQHGNWESGKFSDRFRVQLFDKPATTITSHISKDGHYFIHPDPAQCRSLTVREAARIQTFPDNYFFQGNRTQQFHQVGNAVPPMLATQIARTVLKLLS